jgi:hypothetical protein
LGPAAADPGRSADRLSASYLVALAARVMREVGRLLRRAAETDNRVTGVDEGSLPGDRPEQGRLTTPAGIDLCHQP